VTDEKPPAWKPKVVHPNFRVKTPSRDQVRCLMVPVTQAVYDRIMERIHAGEATSPHRWVAREIEKIFGLEPGDATPEELK
jgi:hypothetical protein